MVIATHLGIEPGEIDDARCTWRPIALDRSTRSTKRGWPTADTWRVNRRMGPGIRAGRGLPRVQAHARETRPARPRGTAVARPFRTDAGRDRQAHWGVPNASITNPSQVDPDHGRDARCLTEVNAYRPGLPGLKSQVISISNFSRRLSCDRVPSGQAARGVGSVSLLDSAPAPAGATETGRPPRRCVSLPLAASPELAPCWRWNPRSLDHIERTRRASKGHATAVTCHSRYTPNGRALCTPAITGSRRTRRSHPHLVAWSAHQRDGVRAVVLSPSQQGPKLIVSHFANNMGRRSGWRE